MQKINTPEKGTALGRHLMELLTEHLNANYSDRPPAVLDVATACAHREIRDGRSFLDAITTGEMICEKEAPEADRNPQRLQAWQQRRLAHEGRVINALSLVCRHAWEHYEGHDSPQELFHNAVREARRVLEAGGTPGEALQRSIGYDPR